MKQVWWPEGIQTEVRRKDPHWLIVLKKINLQFQVTTKLHFNPINTNDLKAEWHG